MTWEVPTEHDCPSCGQTMFKKSGRGRMKPFCINESCENFLPEEKRGYYKKKTEDAEPAPVEEKSTKKATSKKTGSTTRKTTKKKETGA